MRSRIITAAISSALILTACGSDSDTDASDDSATVGTVAQSDGTDASGGTDATDAETDDTDTDTETDDGAELESGDGGGDAPSTGQGTATLTLDNGETFDFDVVCTLDPQIAAGSEILFTATSLRGDLLLDITQFGDEGPVTDIANVTVAESSTFEVVWGASDTYEPLGGSLELSLDGNTINGVGDFYPGDDPIEGGDPVAGNVVANC